MHTLVDRSHAALRKKAAEVLLKDIETPHLKGVLRDMKKALHVEEDGVAIAAPQVGMALRIFIVSGRVFELKKRGRLEELAEPADGASPPKRKVKDIVFINPRVVNASKETEWMVEGCLSLRWLYGSVKRKKKVTVEAYDEKGVKFTRGASGLLAQIFQHELDHLEGVLFTDAARDVEDIPPELQRAHEAAHKKKAHAA
ncbi:peptide deformylase [Candidatus Parcubacteria bacterium]|nr:peptide deformylase [Candidatus Parcubacteria bacterium]